jgi:hypothetical protein
MTMCQRVMFIGRRRKMREQLRQEAVAILSNHLADLDYWCAAYTVDDVNSVTGGCEFDDLADVNAYRVVVKAVLKEMKDA